MNAENYIIWAVWTVIILAIITVIVFSWNVAFAPPPDLAPLPPKTPKPPSPPTKPKDTSKPEPIPTPAPPPTPKSSGEYSIVDGFDPLDAAGLYDNQFTGKSNSTPSCNWKELSKKWATLPMYYNKTKLQSIIDSLQNNNVTMIVSGTGSGKTVIMPKLAHRLLADKLPPLNIVQKLNMRFARKRRPGSVVAVTNPKQLTTVNNSNYSSLLACVKDGREIGYKFRDSPASAASIETQLEYVTDGYLLTVARSDPNFSEYGTIIIDEAHERPVPTDFLLLALKRAMKNRPELRVVVMSATIDTTPFVNWFKKDGFTVGDIEVSGKPNYQVDKVYRPLQKGDTYLAKAISTVMEINSSKDSASGGILIFVPITADTANGCKMLLDACRKKGLQCSQEPTGEGTPNLRCLRLYSGVDDKEKNVAINPSGTSATRHIIFSTNVAESSITVEDLSYVIDSGKVYRVSYDAAADAVVRGKQNVTKAEAKQRHGRVGRRRPGVAILLYSEYAFNGFEAEPPPSILGEDLTSHMFEMMVTSDYTWKETTTEIKSLLTPPTDAQISIAEATMRFYNLIDQNGKPTQIAKGLYDIQSHVKSSFKESLLMLAASFSDAQTPMAKFIACTEKGALLWLSAALKSIGKMPEECSVSDHVTAVRVFDSALKWLPAETAELKRRMDDIMYKNGRKLQASQEALIQSRTTWPWKFARYSSPACLFSDTSKNCPASRQPISIQTCDNFFRAVAVANLMRANAAGKRIFGKDAKPAVNSSNTEPLQNAVHVGNEYGWGRKQDVLSLSSAFSKQSIEKLIQNRK